VLEAAKAVIEEKGFQRASLDEIAARAGLTKGSVYSSFASKDDLFEAILQEKSFRLEPNLTPNMSKAKHFRALGEAAVALLPRARAEAAFVAEFLLYALTHPEMRQRMAERYAARLKSLKNAPARKRAHSSLSSRQSANLVQVLSMGFMIQYMLTPDEITPELVQKAFGLLAGKRGG
jgi:AcrR family transcriptional regulator